LVNLFMICPQWSAGDHPITNSALDHGDLVTRKAPPSRLEDGGTLVGYNRDIAEVWVPQLKQFAARGLVPERKGPGRGPEVDPNEVHKSPASPNRQSTRFPRRWQVPARRPARLWTGRALG